MKIIVVANGEQSEKGHLIDKFDIVIRMGDFEIKGFEKMVGTKTDIVIVTACHELNANPSIIWTAYPKGIFGEPREKINRYYGKKLRTPRQEMINQLYSQLGYFKTNLHPSKGLIALAMVLTDLRIICEFPVYITGYQFLRKGTKHKYWKNDIIEEQDIGHSPIAEEQLITKLIEMGLVKYL